MNTYKAFWKQRSPLSSIEVQANTAYEAQQVAAERFGKRCKRREVTVVLAAAQTETQALQANAEEHAARIQRLKDAGLLSLAGEQVTHVAVD